MSKLKFKNSKSDIIVIQSMDEIPLPSNYGAAELKYFIRRNTYRGAFNCILINNFIFAY